MNLHARTLLTWIGLLALTVASTGNVAFGQGTGGEVEFLIDRPNSRMEMLVTTSRILRLEKEVPRALVNKHRHRRSLSTVSHAGSAVSQEDGPHDRESLG